MMVTFCHHEYREKGVASMPMLFFSVSSGTHKLDSRDSTKHIHGVTPLPNGMRGEDDGMKTQRIRLKKVKTYLQSVMPFSTG